MRTGQLFGSLILFGLVSAPMALRGQKENPGSSLTVRQQVDSEILNLSRNLSPKMSMKEKLKLLEKSIQTVGVIRAKSPRQLSGDELYLEELSISMREIPNSSKFDLGSCDAYKKSLIHNWDPKGGEQTQDAALKKTLDVLEQICRTKTL